ncbi:hypothetical protein NUSPORA_02318 [Nucleospora cyclopteri]
MRERKASFDIKNNTVINIPLKTPEECYWTDEDLEIIDRFSKERKELGEVTADDWEDELEITDYFPQEKSDVNIIPKSDQIQIEKPKSVIERSKPFVNSIKKLSLKDLIKKEHLYIEEAIDLSRKIVEKKDQIEMKSTVSQKIQKFKKIIGEVDQIIEFDLPQLSSQDFRNLSKEVKIKDFNKKQELPTIEIQVDKNDVPLNNKEIQNVNCFKFKENPFIKQDKIFK